MLRRIFWAFLTIRQTYVELLFMSVYIALVSSMELKNCFCSGSRCVRRNQGGKTRGASEDPTFQQSLNFTSSMLSTLNLMPVSQRTEDLPAEVPQDLNFLWQTGLDSQA